MKSGRRKHSTNVYIAGSIQNQQGGEHRAACPRTRLVEPMAKKDAAKPEAKENGLECFGTYRVKRSEQPQVYAEKSIEYPRSEAAEFVQDREDHVTLRRIRK